MSIRRIAHEWYIISVELCRKLISSMPVRLTAVYRARGARAMFKSVQKVRNILHEDDTSRCRSPQSMDGSVCYHIRITGDNGVIWIYIDHNSKARFCIGDF
ncbi:hypothetical protein FBU30_001109 [Linnemannia zychae]|nr:hypothetical protein FBU30_001109 [Linnemannia zychae]